MGSEMCIRDRVIHQADSSVNSARILEMSNIQDKSIATSAINTSSILEIRNTYSSSLDKLASCLELLKQGQNELSKKIHESSANFKVLAENQKELGSLVATLVRSPKKEVTPPPSGLPIIEGHLDTNTTSMHSSGLYSQSQSEQLELANSLIRNKQNLDSGVNLQIGTNDKCEKLDQLENNDQSPFPLTMM